MLSRKFDFELHILNASISDILHHSKWDLVGYSGGSPGLENAVKRWGWPIGPIIFSVNSTQACSFSPMSEFTGSSIKVKCEPVKKDK